MFRGQFSKDKQVHFKTIVRQDNRFAKMIMNTLMLVMTVVLFNYLFQKRMKMEEFLFVSLFMGLPSLGIVFLIIRKWRREPGYVTFGSNEMTFSGTLNIIKRRIALSQIEKWEEKPYHFYLKRASGWWQRIDYPCIQLSLKNGTSILLISYKFRNYNELKKHLRLKLEQI